MALSDTKIRFLREEIKGIVQIYPKIKLPRVCHHKEWKDIARVLDGPPPARSILIMQDVKNCCDRGITVELVRARIKPGHSGKC